MDFSYEGDMLKGGGGGGGALAGIMAGSMLNRDDGKNSTMMIVLAVVFFVIIFIIAIIALAMFHKDNYKKGNEGTDIAAILTPLIAAKSMEGNGYGYRNDLDKYEILQKLEHNEDRAVARQTQSEVGALGLMMTKTASDNEKTNMQEFAKIENQLGQLTMGVGTLLQERNNAQIIQGVVSQLMLGKPCVA